VWASRPPVVGSGAGLLGTGLRRQLTTHNSLPGHPTVVGADDPCALGHPGWSCSFPAELWSTRFCVLFWPLAIVASSRHLSVVDGALLAMATAYLRAASRSKSHRVSTDCRWLPVGTCGHAVASCVCGCEAHTIVSTSLQCSDPGPRRLYPAEREIWSAAH